MSSLIFYERSKKKIQNIVCCIYGVALKIYIVLEVQIFIVNNRHSGSVVERPLCDREVAGSIPGRVIPKTLKMVLAALSLGAQH